MKWDTICSAFIIGLTAAILSFNYFSVLKPLKTITQSNTRASWIDLNAHYEYYLRPSVLVLDLRSISADKGGEDVFAVLVQYAEAMQEQSFDKVILAAKGQEKFTLKGEYFQQLGHKQSQQTEGDRLKIFTENLYRPDGTRAFDSWSGRWISVLAKQTEDFNEFNKQWYVDDPNFHN